MHNGRTHSNRQTHRHADRKSSTCSHRYSITRPGLETAANYLVFPGHSALGIGVNAVAYRQILHYLRTLVSSPFALALSADDGRQVLSVCKSI